MIGFAAFCVALALRGSFHRAISAALAKFQLSYILPVLFMSWSCHRADAQMGLIYIMCNRASKDDLNQNVQVYASKS
jgi:hypothetical protein